MQFSRTLAVSTTNFTASYLTTLSVSLVVLAAVYVSNSSSFFGSTDSTVSNVHIAYNPNYPNSWRCVPFCK